VKIEVKEISASEREMKFELAWEDIEKDHQQFTKKFAKDVELQGFRKGMVPVPIVEKKFGPRIDYDFINEQFSDYYGKALDEKELNPVSQPELIDLDFKKGSPLSMTVKFEIMPEWDMPAYEKGFPIEEYKYAIEDEDIEESLLRLRENAAEVVPVEDGAKSGHHLVADAREIDKDGKDLSDPQESRIVLGKAPFDGETEKALLGVKAGETRTITIKADHGDHAHEHMYKLDVTAVEEHVLPEADDTFAQTVNPDGETLEDLKKKIREEHENHWKRHAESRMEEQIADYFIEKLKDLSLPKSVVEEQAKHIYEDMKKRYPSAPEMDEAAIIENYRDTAEKSLKWQLVKNRVVKDKDLKVGDEDIQAKMDEMLKDIKEDMLESYRKYYESPQIKNQLHDDIIHTKINEHLKSFAKIKTKKISRAERLKETGQ